MSCEDGEEQYQADPSMWPEPDPNAAVGVHAVYDSMQLENYLKLMEGAAANRPVRPTLSSSMPRTPGGASRLSGNLSGVSFSSSLFNNLSGLGLTPRPSPSVSAPPNLNMDTNVDSFPVYHNLQVPTCSGKVQLQQLPVPTCSGQVQVHQLHVPTCSGEIQVQQPQVPTTSAQVPAPSTSAPVPVTSTSAPVPVPSTSAPVPVTSTSAVLEVNAPGGDSADATLAEEIGNTVQHSSL